MDRLLPTFDAYCWWHVFRIIRPSSSNICSSINSFIRQWIQSRELLLIKKVVAQYRLFREDPHTTLWESSHLSSLFLDICQPRLGCCCFILKIQLQKTNVLLLFFTISSIGILLLWNIIVFQPYLETIYANWSNSSYFDNLFVFNLETIKVIRQHLWCILFK